MSPSARILRILRVVESIMPKTKSKFYAVRVGRKPGIYTTWAEAQTHINGYPNAQFKSFSTSEEAQNFMKGAISNVRVSIGPRFDPVNSDLRTPSGSPKTPKKQSTRVLPDIENVESDRIIVYTDGACSNNQVKGMARAGVGVWFGVNDPRNVSEPLAGSRQTNQRAEITAAIRALELHKDPLTLEIRTDSMYLIEAMRTWHKSWLQNNWRTSSGEVENRDLFEQLLEMGGDKVRWVHVPGHQGVLGNEMADRLAVAGAGLSG